MTEHVENGKQIGKQINKEIISVFETRDVFLNLLKVNPCIILMKLGATWCGPCKQISHIVNAFFAHSPSNVICADIDVDQSFDLYSFLKHKRMVNGIPAILCYKRGNTGYVPDDIVTGTDPVKLDAFFKRCNIHRLNIMKQNFHNGVKNI